MDYVCLKPLTFHHNDYQLLSLRHQDIYDIKEWRNAQIEVLRQDKLLTDEDQEQYYHNVVLPSYNQPQPKIILFSFLRNGACIGYGGIVHIDWSSKRGEVSFLLNPALAADPEEYHCHFTAYLKMIKQVAFKQLHFHRLHTETYDIRPHHVAALESEGFIYEGRMREHVLIHGKFVDSILHGCISHESMA